MPTTPADRSASPPAPAAWSAWKPSRDPHSARPPDIGDALNGLADRIRPSTRSVRDSAALLDGRFRPGARRPLRRPGAASPVRGGARGRSRNPADRSRVSSRSPSGDVRRRRDRTAARKAGELLEVARALGRHGRSRNAPGDAGQSLDPVESFMTRWTGGGRMPPSSSSRMILGRELGPDDVEPLTWALAQEGSKQSGGEYLERRRAPPDDRPA